MHVFEQAVANSLNTAAFLTIATLGFALVLWIDDFFNVAHAEFLIVGAFAAYYAESILRVSFVIAAIIAIVGTSLLALVLNYVVYRPLRHNQRVTLLIVALGVFYTIRGVLGSIIAPSVYSLSVPSLGSFKLFGVSTQWMVVVSLVVAAGVIFGVYAFLRRTATGLQARALADSSSLAILRGVSVLRVTSAVWLIVGATAGLAGVMLGVDGTLNTGLGTDQMLLIVAAAILAGVGSIFGVAITAIVIGLMLNVLGVYIQVDYAEAILFAVMVAVLILKPRGLFGSDVNRREV